jgi:hypothetical protein
VGEVPVVAVWRSPWGAGELVAEFADFFGLLGDALVGELEATLQRCLRGACGGAVGGFVAGALLELLE